MSTKLDELVARIKLDVQIKRTRSGKATVETSKTRFAREERERRDKESEAGSLRTLMRASNNSASTFQAKPDPFVGWLEVGLCPVLMRQVCRACGGEEVRVVAELLHLRALRSPNGLPADVWVRRSTVFNLPLETPLWSPTQSIAHCPSCVELTLAERDLRPQPLPVDLDGQLSLFH